MEETLVWFVGGVFGFWLINRAVLLWLSRRVVRQNVSARLQHVLNDEHHKVRGRFE